MRKINHSAANDDWNQAHDDEVIKPLSRAEALLLRQKNPSLSPWVVLAGQAGGGILVACMAWWVSGKPAVGWSALYGAMAVVIPGALFARGLMSKVAMMNPATAVTGFFLWEMVKIGLVLALLFAAPRLVTNLSWPAMLVGMVVTMKVVWLVLWFEAKARHKSKKLSVIQ